MEQEKPISTPLQRITVIDALRGFALLGVILTHMLQHYGIFSFSGTGSEEALFPKSDAAIQWLLQNVIMGRFINIFAFLFGLSFFIQMDKAAKKGIDFRKRFLWRMAILFIIGVIGNCFYTSDILSIYAVFGVLMVFLYRFKSWILIAIASLLLIGLPRILTTSYEQQVKVEQTTAISHTQPRASTIEEPSFLHSAKRNLTTGLERKLNYQFGMFGRGYITLALFIMGLVIGRMRFFEEVHIQKRRNIMLLAGFITTAIATNLTVSLLPEAPSTRMILTGLKSIDLTPSFFVSMAIKDLNTVLFSGVLAMGFIVLYQTRGIGKYLDIITPYGRMGLTNYEMQSVIGCLIFSMWGFGSIFGSWGTTEVFLLGLVLYAAQVIASRYWLHYYSYGPLEWLWRSATYLKIYSARKVAKAAL